VAVPSIALQLRAALFVVAAAALVRARGTTKALRVLARERRRAQPIDVELSMRAVQRAGTKLRAQCLVQSVALTALLSRGGRAPALVLGCHRYEDRQWGSHAWVDCDGTTLEPVPAGPHAELARCAAAQGWVPVQAVVEQP
jgi:hypothetical protein